MGHIDSYRNCSMYLLCTCSKDIPNWILLTPSRSSCSMLLNRLADRHTIYSLACPIRSSRRFYNSQPHRTHRNRIDSVSYPPHVLIVVKSTALTEGWFTQIHPGGQINASQANSSSPSERTGADQNSILTLCVTCLPNSTASIIFEIGNKCIAKFLFIMTKMMLALPIDAQLGSASYSPPYKRPSVPW